MVLGVFRHAVPDVLSQCAPDTFRMEYLKTAEDSFLYAEKCM